MTSDPAADVVRWVQDGERLFAQTLQRLHEAERLATEHAALQAQMEILRAELDRLRAERIDAAETLRAIAEQVTRLATVALQRLGRPVL